MILRQIQLGTTTNVKKHSTLNNDNKYQKYVVLNIKGMHASTFHKPTTRVWWFQVQHSRVRWHAILSSRLSFPPKLFHAGKQPLSIVLPLEWPHRLIYDVCVLWIINHPAMFDAKNFCQSSLSSSSRKIHGTITDNSIIQHVFITLL